MRRIKLSRKFRAVVLAAAMLTAGPTACAGSGQPETQAETQTEPPAETQLPVSIENPTAAPKSTAAEPVMTADAISAFAVSVSAGDITIPVTKNGFEAYVNEPDGTTTQIIACGDDPLSALMNDKTGIPYVALGSEIVLTFTGGPAPDTVKLTDIILNDDGTTKYDYRTFVETEPECRDNSASFILDQNYAIALSSAILPERGYRGFRVTCIWDGSGSAEYGFVLLTDNSLTELHSIAQEAALAP